MFCKRLKWRMSNLSVATSSLQMKRKNMEQVLISLTSIPRRFDSSLIEVLNSLKKQHRKCKIILNIPKEYKKWGEPEIPEELLNDKEIILWRPAKDYGPATKLLGALEYISKNPGFKYVLTVDDDLYYKDCEYLDYILEFSKLMPSCALTTHGIKLKHYPFEHKNGLEYINKFCFVDVPAGYRYVLYPVEPLMKDDSIFTFSEKLPKGIFNDDDAYFGIFLNYINVPLFAMPKKPGIKGILACNAGSSGVTEKVEKSREKNVTEIFQYAVQNKLFLNNNSLLNKKLTLLVHIKARCIYMKYKIKYLIRKSKSFFNKIFFLTDTPNM